MGFSADRDPGDGTITYRSKTIDLTSLQLFFDRGVIEIFGNDGSVCGTRRTYRMDDLNNLEVEAIGLETMDAWQLVPCGAIDHHWALKSKRR